MGAVHASHPAGANLAFDAEATECLKRPYDTAPAQRLIGRPLAGRQKSHAGAGTAARPAATSAGAPGRPRVSFRLSRDADFVEPIQARSATDLLVVVQNRAEELKRVKQG